MGFRSSSKEFRKTSILCLHSLFIDKSIIHRDAASDQAVDKALLWMSRPSGTYCFREHDVFLKGTRQHNTWKFYGEQTRDKILAYAVELTGTQGGTIRGNLYELDYQQHFRHVVEASQPVSVNRLFYEHGTRDIPDGQYFDGSPDRVLGNFLRYEAQPHDPAVLQEALRQEQHSRGRAVPNADRRRTIGKITAAMPGMDGDMWTLASGVFSFCLFLRI